MRRVFIVDDDLPLRETFTLLCEALGVEEAASAGSLSELADRSAQALRANLILIDINLGDGEPNGLAVFRWLKEHGFKGRAVFFTGHAKSDPMVQEVSRAAGVPVLSKPLPIESIEKLLEAA